ncbi:MAG: hypothetical protein AABZ08_03320 [Planctomycetota bacterium]
MTVGAVVFVGMLLYLVVLVVGSHRRTAARSERLEKARTLIANATTALNEKDFVRADRAYADVLALVPDAQSRVGEEEELASTAEAGRTSLTGKLELLEKEAEQARQEQEEARRTAEASAAEQRKQQEKRKRQDQESQQVRAKAKEMYPSYKKAAESLADEILKLLSAVEIGITYDDFTKRLQDLQFNYNKFVLANGGEASLTNFSSYQSLVKAVDRIKHIGRSWKLKIDAGTSKGMEDAIREMWKAIGKDHSAAMAALARNE